MKSEIIISQAEDGRTKIETHFEKETVWLTQAQISELFQKERSVVTKHINNVFAEGELDEESNVQILHIFYRNFQTEPCQSKQLLKIWHAVYSPARLIQRRI